MTSLVLAENCTGEPARMTCSATSRAVLFNTEKQGTATQDEILKQLEDTDDKVNACLMSLHLIR